MAVSPKAPPALTTSVHTVVSLLCSSDRLNNSGCYVVSSHWGIIRMESGGGGVAKCEVMEFCLKLATSRKKEGGLPLLHTTEIFQTAPPGVTVHAHKCVFVHFWGMQKEIWGCLASKVTDLCMFT